MNSLFYPVCPQKEVQTYAKTRARPYQELMAYYKCAIMEVTTKFNVLNEELSLEYDRNPIETVKSRLKSPESIMEKWSAKICPSRWRQSSKTSTTLRAFG